MRQLGLRRHWTVLMVTHWRVATLCGQRQGARVAGVQQLPLWLDVSSGSRKCALRSLPVVHWWNCLRGCACDHRCRVLKADGVFFIVSYGTPENRLSYLENDEYKWHVTVHTVGTSAVAVLGSNCVGGRRRGSRDRELGREMGACSVLVRVVRVAHQHQRCRVLVVLWVTQLADGSVSSLLHLPPPRLVFLPIAAKPTVSATAIAESKDASAVHYVYACQKDA